MVFFMAFIVCSKAENIDTMRGKLMLAWYLRTEHYLFEQGLRPLLAIKDMIGSKVANGMHVLLYQVVVFFGYSTLMPVLGTLPSE